MQISEVWIWASSFLLLLKLSYCCIANHPKCNGLKKKLFIFCHYFVGLPDGSSALLTCVLLCSCFWLFGWPLPKGQNGFPPTSRTLVLTGRGRSLRVPCHSLAVWLVSRGCSAKTEIAMLPFRDVLQVSQCSPYHITG